MASKEETFNDKDSLSYIARNFSSSDLGEIRIEAPQSDESLQGVDTHSKPRNLFPLDPREGIENYQQLKVVLIQTAAGLKPPSGGFRGNYATVHALSGYGHKTLQLAWAMPYDIPQAAAELKEAGKFNADEWDFGHVYMLNTALEPVKVTYWKFTDVHGVYIVALDALTMLDTLPNELQQVDAATWIETDTIPPRSQPYIKWITDNIEQFNATHVLFNDAFASKVTAEIEMCKQKKCRRIEIVHSAEQLPVGPFAGGVPGSAKTPNELALWRDLDGVVSVSLALKNYIKQHSGLETKYIANHVWAYKNKDTGDWPRVRSNYALQTVVMVNPALVKGHKVFLDMAKENDRRMNAVRFGLADEEEKPVYKFIAYMGWGSKPEIIAEMKAANIEIRESCVNMEPAFDATTILIAPSLWFEAWGIVITEAMLRGIPVVASNIGGIPEAKRYVYPLVPVSGITGLDRKADGSYNVPEQDWKPWMAVLDEIMSSQERYNAAADASFFTVRNWVRNFDKREMEKYLLDMMN